MTIPSVQCYETTCYVSVLVIEIVEVFFSSTHPYLFGVLASELDCGVGAFALALWMASVSGLGREVRRVQRVVESAGWVSLGTDCSIADYFGYLDQRGPSCFS